MALTHFFTILMVLFSLVAITSASSGGYGPEPEVKKSDEPEYNEKLPTIMGVQGLIYCKSGPKPMPLPGAVARITCLKVNKDGYEMGSYSFLSGASDEKGYFFATLYPSEVEDDCKLKVCKAFLETSPLETCDVPTDDNNGISGYPLDFYRSLSAKKMMLYSVKPFFYTPKPEPPISNGY
ncbi:hypothetical protein PVL29_008670 [Vitis rotundifolia]|uniref:Proline-rich protein 3 n=1 Tax=Vitis rotundifolia TaxID=103349 RepID=A0AA39DT77_VITRO|nr:hypothetical protein PVL29_008670 [Vitis rotundifolia]